MGLDAEGLQLERLGLVQARAADGAVYLVRTGTDHGLLEDLRPLLESPSPEKVVHAAAGDARALWTRGVRLWGLYDTAVAHKVRLFSHISFECFSLSLSHPLLMRQVIRYQNQGTSLWRANIIGLNDACAEYGIRKNPLKVSRTALTCVTFLAIEPFFLSVGFGEARSALPPVQLPCLRPASGRPGVLLRLRRGAAAGPEGGDLAQDRPGLQADLQVCTG